MIVSYFRLALRHLLKNRLYTTINIVGLAIGLTIYLFGMLLVEYEHNHDHMFTNRGSIYTVGSVFAPTAGRNVVQYPNVRLAYGPLFKAEISQLEQVVRAVHKVRLISVADQHYYQGIRFVDSGFTQLFDFTYLYGGKSAIDTVDKVIITASRAKAWFGRIDVIGETITLEHKHPLRIGAVIADVAADSHFNSTFFPDYTLDVIAPLRALAKFEHFDMSGEWQSLNPLDLTYILLDKNHDETWLQTKINEVVNRHAPVDEYKHITALKVRPLIEANTHVWEALGFPVYDVIKLFATLVLVIVCINYTNLATVQSFSRGKEVGLRKAFGAQRSQLLAQFLFESILLVSFAMMLALGGIELLIPFYNSLTGKALVLSYIDTVPWLILTTVLVGLLAGSYPAYAITRLTPIDSLRNFTLQGGIGGNFYHFMVMVQFSIAFFMLSMVMTIYFQNIKVVAMAEVFPKSDMVLLDRINTTEVKLKRQELRQALLDLPGVEAVVFSSSVPLAQGDDIRKVSPIKTDESAAVDINWVSVDDNFIATYEINLIAGFGFNLSLHSVNNQTESTRVIINQLAAKKLGFSPDGRAIGQSFYSIKEGQKYTIIGLMSDQYFFGVHTKIQPTLFEIKPEEYRVASIKISEENFEHTVGEIKKVWTKIIKDYPVSLQLLDDVFNFFYSILRGINQILALFAVVALSLALIGLFALTAFMTERRSKEIGLHKVMGASLQQIVVLLIWQLSKPVIWSLIFALPLAYVASNIYLDFFPERIEFVFPIIILAGATGVFSAWFIIAIHAIHIATMTPICSLRQKS